MPLDFKRLKSAVLKKFKHDALKSENIFSRVVVYLYDAKARENKIGSGIDKNKLSDELATKILGGAEDLSEAEFDKLMDGIKIGNPDEKDEEIKKNLKNWALEEANKFLKECADKMKKVTFTSDEEANINATVEALAKAYDSWSRPGGWSWLFGTKYYHNFMKMMGGGKWEDYFDSVDELAAAAKK